MGDEAIKKSKVISALLALAITATAIPMSSLNDSSFGNVFIYQGIYGKWYVLQF